MDNSNILFHPFTVKWNDGRCSSIVTDVSLIKPEIKFNEINDEILFKTKALWDTGATSCVITEDTATMLDLEPISFAEIHHAGGKTISKVYLINIILPNKLFLEGIRVTECKKTEGGFGFIVGMNVITQGDFALTNVDGKSTFSFRLPSMDTIDYVQEARKGIDKIFKNVGRNEPCPCGSQKKFKHCHGR